jgi:hypothetical protein
MIPQSVIMDRVQDVPPKRDKSFAVLFDDLEILDDSTKHNPVCRSLRRSFWRSTRTGEPG